MYVGTSSWKYPGWCRMLYDRTRYEYRGSFAETRCKRDCLAEYAEVFKTVCLDAAYYTFPSRQYLEGMVNQTPDDFLFGLKVTDAITIKKYPKLDRFAEQAGKPNESFLNADLFVKAFLTPCEAVRDRIGLLMFEFSRFWPTDYEHGRNFIADLDRFLGGLPRGTKSPRKEERGSASPASGPDQRAHGRASHARAVGQPGEILPSGSRMSALTLRGRPVRLSRYSGASGRQNRAASPALQSTASSIDSTAPGLRSGSSRDFRRALMPSPFRPSSPFPLVRNQGLAETMR